MIRKRFGAFVLLLTCGSVVCLFVAALLHADTPPPQAPMPASRLSAKDTELIEKIQRRTFGYFWDFAHPDSGLARARSTSGNLVTSGGSGFGILAILVAAERNWVAREAARYFDGELGDRLWGAYGFLDAFNLKEGWFAKKHLAIDQGPVIVMIENYRTGLIWKTFMKCEDVRAGLKRLGFTFSWSSSRPLDADTDRVEKARARLHEKGYSGRITVSAIGDGGALPFVDRLRKQPPDARITTRVGWYGGHPGPTVHGDHGRLDCLLRELTGETTIGPRDPVHLPPQNSTRTKERNNEPITKDLYHAVVRGEWMAFSSGVTPPTGDEPWRK